jgi:recombination protein RecA
MKDAAKPKEKNNAFGPVVSTGSTLLDLAISGERIYGGGLPVGEMVEIYGPEGAGKSVLLYQIAGNIQKAGGSIWFNDTEGRADRGFASLFGVDLNDENTDMVFSISETFEHIRNKWEPPKDKINAAFIDSLANLDEEDAEGGWSGARRAAVFSQEIRKTAGYVKTSGNLIVCSNQIRDKLGVTWGKKTKAAGASHAALHQFTIRIEIKGVTKLKRKRKIHSREVERIYGTQFTAYVEKSSAAKPFREAPVYIIFDYGIDDIRANLQFYKDMTGDSLYINPESPDHSFKSIGDAIENIEERELEEDLRGLVIELWQEIEGKFKSERKNRNEP